MITGDEYITKGDAYLNSTSIKNNIKKVFFSYPGKPYRKTPYLRGRSNIKKKYFFWIIDPSLKFFAKIYFPRKLGCLSSNDKNVKK